MSGSRAADIVARRLYEAGCRHVFGIPGGEVLTLMDAMDRVGIRYLLCRHENSGGFMAEGTHHAGGAPGVLIATVGPGVANAVNVVANAQQDKVPLIFLTGCIDAAQAVTFNHQIFDHSAVLKPLVKASFTLADGAVAHMIDKAIAIATDGPPGPVHIDIPVALAAQEQPPARPVRRATPAAAGPVDGKALREARRLLGVAKRPLMIAGLEALQHGAEAAVAAFAVDHGIPLITTYKAKGILPESHPLSLGGAGLSPVADRTLMPLIAASDLLLLVGYDPIEMRSGWVEAWDPAERPVIEFAAAPNTHYVHQATWSFVGDIGAGIAALRRDLSPVPTWRDDAIATARRTLRSAFGIDEEWGPAAICDEVRQALPDDGIVACDTGAHRILLSQVWECRQPRSLLQSTGLCTMGCGLPLAMGVKIAAPDRPVVAFTGDGGMEMVLGELATLRDLALPIPIVVFVDSSLALIEMKQRGSNLAPVGCEMGTTDFAAVARAMGGNGVDVRDRSALAQAIRQALEGNRFTVIAAHIARGAYDGRI